jgi:peptide/nickel transport system permease protein
MTSSSFSSVYRPPRSARIFLQNKAAVLGMAIVLIMILMAIFAPLVAPYGPLSQELSNRLQPPGKQHLMGTDKYGRDILSRVVWGTRVSLQVGVIAVGIGASLGTIIGLISGYFGGVVDNILMRLMEILLTLPMLVLALVMVALLGSSLTNVMIAVGISILPRFARVIRGSALSVREMDFVDAARVLGAKDSRIIFRHVLPNTLHAVIVLATLRVATAILIEATLSFLGLGVEYDKPTWGSMINEGRMYLQTAPWLAIFPGIAIMLMVLGLSLFGDGLREALDPRLRE